MGCSKFLKVQAIAIIPCQINRKPPSNGLRFLKGFRNKIIATSKLRLEIETEFFRSIYQWMDILMDETMPMQI